jgi:hypothetical protein
MIQLKAGYYHSKIERKDSSSLQNQFLTAARTLLCSMFVNVEAFNHPRAYPAWLKLGIDLFWNFKTQLWSKPAVALPY